MIIACGIEYDGTDYHGFQRQSASHGPTVQGTLEAAVTQISGVQITVMGAGRTDVGVHASGQVIHFRTESRLTVEVWRRALNAVLPSTVVVRWAKEMPEGFHARFSAQSRSYRYTIWNECFPTALRARYAYHCSRELDVTLMDDACRYLLGRKDFGAFGHSPNDSNPLKPGPHHCIRTMLEARCLRDHQQAELIYCDFTADAFLTGQVRRMVGTLLLVGQQRLSVAEFAEIVQRAEKTHPGSAAPSLGLCLVRVEYPEKFGVNGQ
ncbi:tRNA pseudouridine(38-40) synthase TruA [Ktedonobacter racemifer]|uniref:tRNA pseudouridine synthase A n=1 Tax=Ktedonobacter racemifer DSM 44963 TaxID=485913 RepID=D6THB5_KTERA|nr:tRNA pseudouridine(38-40) synthase TruA [Ktedonobacter racemifer]EFH90857.1 tRNA pseudouridine synthase A [Ktedonobacter racemifer DSM 44963]